MRLSKIEKQPFIFGRYDLVTPVVCFRFVPHISSKNGERVAMIAIAGDHLPNCVAAGEKNCEDERDGEVGTQRRGFRVQGATPNAFGVDFQVDGWEAVSPRGGSAATNLRREKQTQRWN